MSERNKFKIIHKKVGPLEYLEVKGFECPYCGKIFVAQSWLMKVSYCPNCGKNLWEDDDDD